MRKKIYIVMGAVVLGAMFVSCSKSIIAKALIEVLYEKIETPYDLEKAQELVAPIDQLFLELGREEEVSRSTLVDYQNRLDELTTVGNDKLDFSPLFSHEIYKDKTIDPIPVEAYTFYPTIFHEGIEVLDAKAVVYKGKGRGEDGPVEKMLVVTVGSVTPLLGEWEKKYHFEEEEGIYKLSRFAGTVNRPNPKDFLPEK